MDDHWRPLGLNRTICWSWKPIINNWELYKYKVLYCQNHCPHCHCCHCCNHCHCCHCCNHDLTLISESGCPDWAWPTVWWAAVPPGRSSPASLSVPACRWSWRGPSPSWAAGSPSARPCSWPARPSSGRSRWSPPRALGWRQRWRRCCWSCRGSWWECWGPSPGRPGWSVTRRRSVGGHLPRPHRSPGSCWPDPGPTWTGKEQSWEGELQLRQTAGGHRAGPAGNIQSPSPSSDIWYLQSAQFSNNRTILVSVNDQQDRIEISATNWEN